MNNLEPFQNPPAPEMVPEVIPKDVVMKEETVPEDLALAAVPNLENEHTRKALLKKIYSNGIKKKQSVRIKERRMKQNRMLRKSLLPKNALMSLNELKGIQISDFTISPVVTGGGFSCSVCVNNIQYEAVGLSKAGAKNFCCEKAIRDIMIQKMMNLRCIKQQQQLKEDNASNDNTTEMKIEDIMDAEDNCDDDVPMLNLASYAIHKLFCQWEAEGFDVPDIVNVLGNAQSASTQSLSQDKENPEITPEIKPKNDLPEGYESMHPATLLCMVRNLHCPFQIVEYNLFLFQMRPGITFELIETIGQTPNIVQRVQVKVDDNNFIGSGRSKKLARKDAATYACNEIFGTNYPHEETS